MGHSLCGQSAFLRARHWETIEPMGSTGLIAGLLLILGASVEDFPKRLSYPLGRSFADLARAFSGTDAKVVAGSRGTFAEISTGFARVQSSEITGGSCSTLAQGRLKTTETHAATKIEANWG
jgi:hypothetical protein